MTSREQDLPTKHDQAYERAIQLYRESRIWELTDAGFIMINGQYQRQLFTKEEFTALSLRWMTLPPPYNSVRRSVTISEDVARELPRLSSPQKIKYAMSLGWSLIGLRLDDIFSKPTPPYRETLKFNQQTPGMYFTMYRDEFLYRLILAHLEDDVINLAAGDGQDSIPWITSFTEEVGKLATQRFPGLWDYSPLD